ncbi:phosphoesterase RecJ domain-containing protein [Amphibacillus marinus]|uniref:Phosphoesterase RecJ domain-containing protein n=1 Tax=Amphibacillus marinus TaxID=872970 RepID=A0A1H8T2H5_9BACI|nr:bifunctional oligoribonuclease/PAP phosphatase NrnA [Amphibacillus marinus]SEO85132.1 phosphoesterase RecJ domain-containing protein [Amphibacillus marinus]
MDIKVQIINKIKQYETIIIHRHVRPDPDALGSQVGLAQAILAQNPAKKVFCVGEMDPSLRFLAEMDLVPDDLYQDALVIVCDTANRPRIDDERYQSARELIKIDHHPDVDCYGDLSWVDPQASSTSEMIFKLIQTDVQNILMLNDRGAELLYAGIVGDTGRFLYPSTTEETFNIAGELVRYTFDRTALYNQLYEVEPAIARLKGHILDGFLISEAGVVTSKLTKEMLRQYDVSTDQTSMLVSLFGDIKGVLAWVFFVEEEQLIRVRIRSKGPAINAVAAEFNGGGHPLASGATVYSWAEAATLTAKLEQTCQVYQDN